MSKTNKVILLTGFEPFGGDTFNPSEAIARQLDNRRFDGFTVQSYILPVATDIASSRLTEIVEALQPAALVSLGLAAGRDGISLERVAVNLRDWVEPDNTGQNVADQPVIVDGPAAYFATLPLRTIKAGLDSAEINAHLSATAGLFLCNQIMYWGLHLAATRYPTMLSGFIHLPATPELAATRTKPIPSLPLEVQQQAVEQAIMAVAHHHLPKFPNSVGLALFP